MRHHSVYMKWFQDRETIQTWGCSPLFGEPSFEPIWSPDRTVTLKTEYDRVRVAVTGELAIETIKRVVAEYLSYVAAQEAEYFRYKAR